MYKADGGICLIYFWTVGYVCGSPTLRWPIQYTTTCEPSRLFPGFTPLLLNSIYICSGRLTQSLMEGAEKGEKEAPLLQIDPKWYVQYLDMLFWSLITDWTQLPRCSPSFLPTNQDR